MHTKRSQRLAIAAILATGIAGVALCAATLSGLADPAEGDLLFSGSPTILTGLAVVLIALVARIGLELLDASARRPARQSISRPVPQGARRPWQA